MSQSRKVKERLRKSKLLLPKGHQDMRQLWLLVRQEPADNRQGCFFVTHGGNYDKFAKRRGFEVMAHSFDKTALTIAARTATLQCGPAYQPPNSAHGQGHLPEPEPEPQDREDLLLPGLTKPPEDFLN